MGGAVVATSACFVLFHAPDKMKSKLSIDGLSITGVREIKSTDHVVHGTQAVVYTSWHASGFGVTESHDEVRRLIREECVPKN